MSTRNTLRLGLLCATALLLATVALSPSGGEVSAGSGVRALDASGASAALLPSWSPARVTPLFAKVAAHELRSALDAVPSVVVAEGRDATSSHMLAHALGYFAFTAYPSPAAAFTDCVSTYNFGCYHGVTEAYLLSLPQVRPELIATLCQTKLQGSGPDLLSGSCFHGVGHGLATYYKYDLRAALTGCDALGVAGQLTCYDGALMEATDAGLEGTLVDYIRPNDLWYPCTVIAQRYAAACYHQQVSVLVSLLGTDPAVLAPHCEEVPSPMRAVCASGVGSYLRLAQAAPVAQTRLSCGVFGSGAVRDSCLNGALVADPTTLALSEIVSSCESETDAKELTYCWGYLGHQLFSSGSSVAERERACLAAGSYKESCRAAALRQ